MNSENENVLDMYSHVAQDNAGISTSELDTKVESMVAAREDYDAKKKISSDAHKEYEKLKFELLEMMQLCGKDKYIVDGLGTVSKNIKKTAKVPKDIESKKALLGYFRNLGEEVYINTVTVNSMTLNSFIKQRVDDDPTFEMPGVGELKTTEEIRFTKARRK